MTQAKFFFSPFFALFMSATMHHVSGQAAHDTVQTKMSASSYKRMDILLNQDINRPIGIPVKSKMDKTVICISEGIMEQNNFPFDTLVISYWLKQDTLYMDCVNTVTQYSIVGQFYVPPVQGINFSVSYDPETFDGVLQPYQFYVPIRIGVWLFGSPQKGYDAKTYNSRYEKEFYDIDCAGRKPGRVLKP